MWIVFFTSFLSIVALIRLFFVLSGASGDEKTKKFYQWLLQLAILSVAWYAFIKTFHIGSGKLNGTIIKKSKTEKKYDNVEVESNSINIFPEDE